ncbi:YgaP family membrane protein [Hydrogenovibrio marinus]|uniref:Sulfurtransferase n=1 Tax=Hydrogenovibrio marinus TaxID=28885 RepID=A0A066ZS61_HYDMR|nr:DUF2892 domain-containing protein [Hydrogenovibrio marinus]KDN95114.1 sulfurtransferase [Hydrogenovibrio marinus]BBN59587.1 sulfurtransferase [Hydrogenovibrio marinus]
MKIEKIMMMIVGTMILVSVALGYYVSATWLLLTAFIGVNLLISAFTGFCPMATILRKLGLQHGCAFRGCAQ